jgi:hypothetical protein
LSQCNKFSGGIFCLLAGVFLLSRASCSAEPPPPTAEEVLSYLGFDAKAKQDFLAGKIVSKGFKEDTDKELAVTVAMVVPIPLTNVFTNLRAGKLFEADRDVIEFKEVTGEEDFDGVRFGPNESAEIRDLSRVEPGSKFNLSEAEVERFRALRKRFVSKNAEKDPACVDAMTAEYRGMLRDRCKEYREKGLGGIEPYTRGSDKAQPGEELRIATRAARLLEDRFPAFHRVFLNYPRDNTKEFEHRFYWIKQKVEERPAFILAHRIFYARPDGCLITERQFYVGHSYNSLQIVVGCLPSGDKTMIFYTNRTSCDQVAGIGGGLRHNIGRNMMRD